VSYRALRVMTAARRKGLSSQVVEFAVPDTGQERRDLAR